MTRETVLTVAILAAIFFGWMGAKTSANLAATMQVIEAGE